jgi:hypothetical protein
MVGRLVEKKGHADALAALARLGDGGTPAELVVVGAGPARGAVEAEAARLGVTGRLRLLPPTDRAGLAAHFEAADVFLHSSVTAADGDVEGIPNVVVEAAATGLPVVGTRHGGIAEVIEEGRSGLLVPERDPEALAAALASLAAEPERRLALGRGAAERARRDFDLRAQLDAHEKLYRELLAGPPRPLELPDDFFALARKAVGGGPRSYDHAQAAAVAALLGDPGAESVAASPLDRAFEAPSAWRRPWRSGAELALDLAGAALSGPRARSRARAEALDRRVLAALRAGRRLAEVPPALLAAPLRDLEGEPPPSGWRKLRARLAGAGEAAADEG